MGKDKKVTLKIGFEDSSHYLIFNSMYVDTIEYVGGEVRVHNLEVDAHTYFAGGVLVHDKEQLEPEPRPFDIG